MKYHPLHSTLPVLAILGLAFLVSCANVVRPTGGERDQTGPKIVRIEPAAGTLNYTGKVVDFYFDEFLKPGSYRKELFISPVPRFEPIVTVKNKRLRVEFQTDLRDSTTYVISLGTGIKDFNEGNGLDKAFTYAFSTGNQLDTLKMEGTVKNAWTLKGEKEMKIIVYPADEVEGNDIYDVRPVYATETDEQGNFTVEYLKEGPYKVYAVADQDQSYSYNSELEMIGLMGDPLVDLRDTNERERKLELLAFLPDMDPPAVKTLRWTNSRTLHLKTNEAIRLAFREDSLKVTVSDTFGNNAQPIRIFRYGKDSKSDLYLHSPIANDAPYDVTFTGLMDTLGQAVDTTVRIDPQMIDRDNAEKLFLEPEIQLAEDRLLVLSYFNLPASLDTSQVILKDTSGNVIELDAENLGFEMRLLLSQFPPKDSLYQLVLKPGIPRPEPLDQDTTVTFELRFPDLDEYGNLRGKIIPDSAHPEKKWVMLVLGSKGAKAASAPATKSAQPDEEDDDDGGGGRGRSRGGGGGDGGATPARGRSSGGGSGDDILERITGDSYSLQRYPPGQYAVKFFHDADGNGYFTPGSLFPYTMPEEVYLDPNPLEIRAKWDVEGYNVFPGAPLPEPEVQAVAPGDSVPPGDGTSPPPGGAKKGRRSR